MCCKWMLLAKQFTATIKAEGSAAISINDEGLVEILKPKS